MKLLDAESTLESMGNQNKGRKEQTYFKTGKGQYAENDIFLNVNIPQVRNLAIMTEGFDFKIVEHLLNSKYHEIRMYGSFLLQKQYECNKKDEQARKQVFQFYVDHLQCLNNWDLIDLTCYKIIGDYLLQYNELSQERRSILHQLAKSENIWKQRAAIVSTMTFIKNNQLDDIYEIALMLLTHPHDLIHKAVGWLLREAGKKNESRLTHFIQANYSALRRTTLRYAIERMDSQKRQMLLSYQQK